MSLRTQKKRAPNQLVIKQGAVPPAVRLMHISDKEWEQFIASACRLRTINGASYASVILLGNANDKGRDIEARLTKELKENQWDLYQAKHYGNALTPSDIFPELAKLFRHLLAKSYPTPRKYYICGPRNSGPTLHDLIAAPGKLQEALLTAWREGKNGLLDQKELLTPEMEEFIQDFDFSRFEECLVADLIDWHANDRSAHFALFGIEPERGDDPEVPMMTEPHEAIYIEELLLAYAEHQGSPITVADAFGSDTYGEHLAAARSAFYSAEGLRRFSRDIYPDDEFGKLLTMVKTGISVALSPQLKTGLDRHDAAVSAASSLNVSDSVLHPRLRGGDLPGSCHHLVNEKRLKWVRK
ncbi:hypothetical protein M2650_13150 [Luteimonas sp. SX5]|uniref:ABC-three component systems C-terminal domain-containing protein n=1 Tax=Luteimonas galliterrae TaxID=2940486 RepID=A0ABT0MMV7_9GAMM|nr:ABC-three component system protein [Luteimonas galliterrae]MCL1635569.1 hypothetical protein [Luteimonas galliterrae]